MKIEIPDIWLARMTNCPDDTPPEDCLKIHYRNIRQLHQYIGEYVANQIKNKQYEKS